MRGNYAEPIRSAIANMLRLPMTLAMRRRTLRLRHSTRAARAVLRGELPPRYEHYSKAWFAEFWELALPGVQRDARILDVGSGRRPALSVDRRPPNVTYVGLDLARSELEAAGPGSYDEVVVSDISERVPELVGRFDLIVCWQVLEHVQSLPRALDNLHAYLVDGGYVAALLSGRYSAFGLVNILLPGRLGSPLVARIMRRDPATVFHAYYDHCYRSGLQRLLRCWSHTRVRSAWCGAKYFDFCRVLQAGYVLYEEWVATAGHEDLATHYFLQLRK